MADFRFVLNTAGVRELLKSSEMQQICEDYASAAAARLGDGYAHDSYIGKTRVNASVYAETYKARKANMENNTILKALGGGK